MQRISDDGGSVYFFWDSWVKLSCISTQLMRRRYSGLASMHFSCVLRCVTTPSNSFIPRSVPFHMTEMFCESSLSALLVPVNPFCWTWCCATICLQELRQKHERFVTYQLAKVQQRLSLKFRLFVWSDRETKSYHQILCKELCYHCLLNNLCMWGLLLRIDTAGFVYGHI